MSHKDDELHDLRNKVDDFITETQIARGLSERDRDYYDGKQWTSEQLSILKKRKQAPIVSNRIKPKVKGIKGLYTLRLTDPKAYPRTPKHEKSSAAITDALRYVADNNDLQSIKLKAVEETLIEGYTGVEINVQRAPNGDVEVDIDRIPFDRCIYDPHSRREDFKDSSYMGHFIWMDTDIAARQFNVSQDDLDSAFEEQTGDETFDDRPRWIEKRGDNSRVRIVKLFFLKNDKWHVALFTGNMFLVDPQEVPLLDEFGEPENPMELVSLYVDRDNNRYGEVRDWIDIQDEINHRRSKALHFLSQRQTVSRKGAIKNVPNLKRELQKGDGHVELNGDKNDFDILPTGDMAQGQFALYQDSKDELNAVSFNAQLAGASQGDLSGNAIDKLQSAGTLELNDMFNILNSFEKRIYRQIWNRVKQFWDAEKWIRVTDDQKNLRWVGLNSQITLQQALEERIEDESIGLEERQSAALVLQGLQETKDPRLNQVVEVRNNVAEIDVDIILEQSFDSVNIQQEQFKLLAQFASAADIDILELIELSTLRGKDELIEKIERRRAAQAQSGANSDKLEEMKVTAKAQDDAASAGLKNQKSIEQQLINMKIMNGTEDLAKLEETQAKTAKTTQDAIQKNVETQILITQPLDKSPQVVI